MIIADSVTTDIAVIILITNERSKMNKVIKKETPSQNEVSLPAKVADNPKVVNLDTWIATRQEFINKVNTIVVEGKDYHVIKDKKSLAKGGAEKVASIFGWVATFQKDAETLEMVGNTKGTIAYICRLTKDNTIIGEGRGARSVAQDKGDVNKTIKMAQKSAYIDAVIRASGLSDIFTQDLEDMNGHDISPAKTINPITDKQKKFILDLMKQKGVVRLEDIGISDPGTEGMTSEWASATIHELQTLPNKSAIEQEAKMSEEEVDRIAKEI